MEEAGYGLTIQYTDATRKDISEACRQHCNNYDAELKAIRSALQTISEDCDNPNPPCVNNIVIFTDSQSAIQAIAQMQHHKQPIVTDILTTANKLHNQNDVETYSQWIPGHCDILLWGAQHNDKLHKLQKKAIRIIMSSNFLAHSEPIFLNKLHLKSYDIYKCQLLKFLFKLVNKQLPTYFNQLPFPFNNQLHHHETKGCKRAFVPRVNHEFSKKKHNVYSRGNIQLYISQRDCQNILT